MTRTELVERLQGVFVPMFTPFTANGGAIDETQLRSNVRYLTERGIRILNPAGTTGEFWTLTPEEHRDVVRVVIEAAHEACPEALVVAGATGINLAMTLDLARFAADCGSPIVQIAPPFYLPVSDSDLVEYYSALSRGLDIAIMIYEMPQATGVHLRGDVLARICEACPNVIALKTAALADTPRALERLVRRFGKRLRIFSGMGVYYAPFTYMSGAAGITDTLANAVPEFGLQLDALARSRRWEEMNNLYQDAFDVLEIEMRYGRAGLNGIGNACGITPGPNRFPMTDDLTPADRDDIRRRLREWSFSRNLVTE